MSSSFRNLLTNGQFWRQVMINLAIVLSLQWLIQALFFNKTQAPDVCSLRSGQMITIGEYSSESSPLARPLVGEIDFVDKPEQAVEEKTTISLPHADFLFSNFGAILEQVVVKRQTGGQAHDLPILNPLSATDKERRTFLVAFDEMTPFFYQLQSNEEKEFEYQLTYSAETQRVRVTKIFHINKSTFDVGLDLAIEPLNGQEASSLQPRIILPAPVITDIASTDMAYGVVWNDQSKIQKIKPGPQDQNAWISPKLFGVEDRYALSALISDKDNFVQRAYYRIGMDGQLLAYLEGQQVPKNQTYALSFYVGPKQADAMAAVDDRLLETFDYGWFASISRFLLKALNFLYDYLHNYGLAIIALTLLMNILMLPITVRGERKMQESMKANAEIQRKMRYLEQKYKNDREALAREKMALMRSSNIGLSGCLPMLLTIPIFIALNRVLSSSIELYKAPFFGWIQDLSASDPYYILPLLVTLSFFFQKTNTNDPRQGMTNSLMAIFFGAITATLSAGLALFIATNTFFRLFQSALVRKRK